MTTAAAAEPRDEDAILLLWSQGDHRAVAREILSRPTPDAIRAVMAIRDEYAALDGDPAGSREVRKILTAIDAEHAELAAALAS